MICSPTHSECTTCTIIIFTIKLQWYVCNVQQHSSTNITILLLFVPCFSEKSTKHNASLKSRFNHHIIFSLLWCRWCVQQPHTTMVLLLIFLLLFTFMCTRKSCGVYKGLIFHSTLTGILCLGLCFHLFTYKCS